MSDPTGFVQQVAKWRDWDMWDEKPTEEEVLHQFVYGVISDFVAENAQRLVHWLTDEDDDSDDFPGLSAWLDEYASRPPDEPSGWQRVADA